MKASLPILLVWTSPDDYVFSASQISTHIECERKWAWGKIAKIETPPSPAAALGSRVHKVLEDYLTEGTSPDFVSDRKAASIATSGLHLLPAPKTEGMLVEKHYAFKSSRTGFVYHGYKDVFIRPGVPVPSLGFDGSRPIVLDHKTTKKIGAWPKDLQFDTQAALYALHAMARYDSDSADLGWIYYQTEGASRAHPELARLEAQHALRLFDAIEREAEAAANALAKGLQPLDLPPDTAACRAYGGCPYQSSICQLTPSQRIQSRMSNSIIASLAKRVQGVDAQPSNPEVTPPAATASEAPAQEAPVTTVSEAPVAINPPEGDLPVQAIETKLEEVKPKKTAAKRSKKEAEAPYVQTFTATVPAIDTEELARRLVAEAQDTLSPSFTLYVDCVPIGKAARFASKLIAEAQERLAKENGVADYRLVDYGKGTPYFVAHVMAQVDGSTDLVLDSRTPEGAVLLEPLSAKASVIVRGFR